MYVARQQSEFRLGANVAPWGSSNDSRDSARRTATHLNEGNAGPSHYSWRNVETDNLRQGRNYRHDWVTGLESDLKTRMESSNAR